MAIAGIDYSSRAVDIVLLDEDTDAAEWHRFELTGDGAFDRARDVVMKVPTRAMSFWDDVLAVGIEQPRGHFATVALARIQGAVLGCIPGQKLVQPWNPKEWRKAVGLKGNASKYDVALYANERFYVAALAHIAIDWPQDAKDAYCIALATRAAIQVTA